MGTPEDGMGRAEFFYNLVVANCHELKMIEKKMKKKKTIAIVVYVVNGIECQLERKNLCHNISFVLSFQPTVCTVPTIR